MAKSKANKDQEDKSGSNAPKDDEDFGLPELEYEALDDDEGNDEDAPAEEESAIYSSPSFDEPKGSSDEDDSKVSSIFDVEEPDNEEIADVFGGTTPPAGTQQPFYGTEDDGDSAKSFTRIIIIGAVAFVLIGFAFLYWHHKDDDKKVVAKATPKEQKVEPKPLEPKPEPVKAEPVKKAPAKPVVSSGEVVTLTEKTGRSYVIVGSFFDGDLADDYGKKLINEGLNATVIKPFGKSRFYRVSISDFESYQEAVDEAEKAKSTYGGEVWALRY